MEIARAFETSVKKKSQVFLGSKGLERGHPCGLQGGKAVSITAKHEGFLGFVEANLVDGRCLVTIRGACLFKVKEIKTAKTGNKNFCNGVNDFNLSEGYPIGVLKHIQPDMPNYGMICFKRFDDIEQFYLKK